MKLERHVGGLSQARKLNYLKIRGWNEGPEGWLCANVPTPPLPLKRAIHHQLTDDLTAALAAAGWTVVGYSPRGYARMKEGSAVDGKTCSLPAALRRQARREGRKVAELTYTLFLAAVLKAEAKASRE